jgi:hypothetical protein
MARAKAAGLGGKDNWRSYPRQMLRARVISEGVRATFPAVLNGMYTPEEVGEFDAPRPARAVKVEPKAEVIEVIAPNITVEKIDGEPVIAVRETEQTIPAEEPDWALTLEKRIFEHEAKVNAFLIAKGQITEGQTFRDIADEGYRNRVLSNTPRFIDAVLKEVA